MMPIGFDSFKIRPPHHAITISSIANAKHYFFIAVSEQCREMLLSGHQMFKCRFIQNYIHFQGRDRVVGN